MAERAATDEMAASDVATVTEFANSRFEASEMGETTKPESDVANRANVPTGTSAGKKGATDINADATTNPCPATACDAPFIVRNTVLNVLVQLLPNTSARAIANVNVDEDVVENIPQIMTTGATINVATAHATRPINAWGQHGFVVAEVYKVLASIEPPWGSLCI